MVELATQYMGLKLRNPVVVSSSGLTQSVEDVVRCAEAGAGAVVLKSIFEEQIDAESGSLLQDPAAASWHPEAAEYIMGYGRAEAVGEYLKLIKEAKAAVDIPVIASIHCVTPGRWTDFAKRIEKAGADALELNVFVLPSDPRRDGKANERVYFDVAKAVTKKAKLPVALKVGSYFSGLSKLLTQLSFSGIKGLVLFNRFVRMDFDIDNLRVITADVRSGPNEMLVPLRWVSILSGTAGCDLAATTGVHDGAGVVKQLLAGAAAVQVCSTLYKNGVDHLGTILDEVTQWMDEHKYSKIEHFRGKLSRSASENPASFERVQFMRATSTVG